MTNEKESRWFLIEHNCGSILTIKSDKYADNETVNQFRRGQKTPPFPLICPSCPEIIDDIIKLDLGRFLLAYRILTKSLKDKHFTIREIQPKELEAMKNLGYRPLDKQS